MDQIVAQALTLYAKLCKKTRAEAANLIYEPRLSTLTLPLNGKSRRTTAATPGAELATTE